jgi:rubrerythrin
LYTRRKQAPQRQPARTKHSNPSLAARVKPGGTAITHRPATPPDTTGVSPMSLNMYDSKGTALDSQRFSWRDMVMAPISKLDDDAFTRVRIILMNGIEMEANRFSHSCARMNDVLRSPLAKVRRIEQHQATSINWLIGADHSPLETTIAYEQVAIEITAAVAQNEKDPYLAQVYRFGMLEDFDHLYRYAALLDRMEGKDANNILQCYTDIMAGRPTVDEHRAPEDDLRRPYERDRADVLSKLHALTIMSAEQQTHNYYMNIGPLFTDPLARQLYAEIASIEEQHVTQYESIIDPNQSWLEQWLMHEATEVYTYYSCVQSETNPRIKALWERFLDYELGHFNLVSELFRKYERRDPQEIVPNRTLPEPIAFASQREFVRKILGKEVDLRATGADFVSADKESHATRAYRDEVNAEGSPSETVAAGYRWNPGTEIGPAKAA